MQITEKLIRPIIEASYLTAENASRYRVIIRLFFTQNEKMNYWLTQDDVYYYLKQYKEFHQYTTDQCRSDLDQLSKWGNLSHTQDISKVPTLDEFKNRKFRYQLSEYTVEIERMTLKLENLFIEGGSLEPALLERLRMELSRISEISQADAITIYGWWDSVNTDFKRLNQNYQDYIRELNSARAEELMKTTEFIMFKDKLVDYLQTFIRSLQKNTAAIKVYLSSAKPEEITAIVEKIIKHELSIPRLDLSITRDDIVDMINGKWLSISNWFIGPGGGESSRLFEATNGIIRRITRYAAQISELYHSGANRREEYRKFCELFLNCNNLNEAHMLSSLVFGVERPVHISYDGSWNRETDDISSSVYNEAPFSIKLTPKVREVSRGGKRSGIVSHYAEKAELLSLLRNNADQDRKTLEKLIKGNILDFAGLPVLRPEHRRVLLNWLSKGLSGDDKLIKTEFGRSFRIDRHLEHETCELHCLDGSFIMPHYRIIFERERVNTKSAESGERAV